MPKTTCVAGDTYRYLPVGLEMTLTTSAAVLRETGGDVGNNIAGVRGRPFKENCAILIMLVAKAGPPAVSNFPAEPSHARDREWHCHMPAPAGTESYLA